MNNQGIAAIYARNASTVFRLCCSFMKDAAEAEDMMQETFMKLMKSRARFESEEHEKAWLIVTASNLCKDALRARKRLTSLPDPDAEADDADTPWYENYPDEVTEAVMSLPDEYKTAVYLYYYEEYSVKEIAGYMKKSESAIKMQLARARNRLKNMLGEDYGK